MSNDAFSQRQQEILLKAALLAAFALILTFLVARRLAQRLSAPISTMGQAVEAIQSGDYKTSLPILDDGEIGDLARHINNLASGLDRASREQEQAIGQLSSTPFIGVRSSWLIIARKSDFARFAWPSAFPWARPPWNWPACSNSVSTTNR